jgi:hypothetical protein
MSLKPPMVGTAACPLSHLLLELQHVPQVTYEYARNHFTGLHCILFSRALRKLKKTTSRAHAQQTARALPSGTRSQEMPRISPIFGALPGQSDTMVLWSLFVKLDWEAKHCMNSGRLGFGSASKLVQRGFHKQVEADSAAHRVSCTAELPQCPVSCEIVTQAAHTVPQPSQLYARSCKTWINPMKDPHRASLQVLSGKITVRCCDCAHVTKHQVSNTGPV